MTTTLSSPIRPHGTTTPHAFSTPLMPRSINVPSPSTSHTSFKPVYSSPLTAPVSEPGSSRQTPIFDFADAPPSRRRTDPRIPERRLHSRNPLAKSSTARQQWRREKYLDEVQQKREEGRWAARSDQMLRLDWLKRQREWEEVQAGQAPESMDDAEREYDEMDASAVAVRSGLPSVPPPYGRFRASLCDGRGRETGSWSFEQGEDEAMIQAQEGEMEALIAMHDQEQPPSPIYGSEDEELDEALAGLVDVHGRRSDAMDIS